MLWGESNRHIAALHLQGWRILSLCQHWWKIPCLWPSAILSASQCMCGRRQLSGSRNRSRACYLWTWQWWLTGQWRQEQVHRDATMRLRQVGPSPIPPPHPNSITWVWVITSVTSVGLNCDSSFLFSHFLTFTFLFAFPFLVFKKKRWEELFWARLVAILFSCYRFSTVLTFWLFMFYLYYCW